MGVVIEAQVWEPNPAVFIFMPVLCLLSIICLPQYSTKSVAIFNHGSPSSLLRFQRGFLLLFSLSSVMEGLSLVTGEYELASFGLSREQIVLYLSVGSAAALVVGTFLGMLSDMIGHKKVCLMFCLLHLFVAIWKRIVSHPSVCLASICLSLANAIFSFSFETWIVVEHDKQGHGLDALNDMFWLMSFLESASFVGSQVLANWSVCSNGKKCMVSLSTTSAVLAIISIVSITQGWRREFRSASFKDYRISFYEQIFGDKRICLLAWAQSCIQFSVVVFWVLWAPTIVADGREVHLGLIYPCLLGAKMLGSTAFPWFIS